MSFNDSEKQIWELALKNTEATAKQVANVYITVSREIVEELKNFFKIVDPSWSQQYQAERLKRVFEQLAVRLELITGLSRDAIEKGFLKQYYDTYYRYAYSYSEFATGAQIIATNQFLLLPFSIQSESVILAALNEKIGDKSFLQLTRAMQEYLRQDLRSAIAAAIQKGESVAMLEKRLKQVIDQGIASYAATARTEMLKAFSLAQEASSEEAEDLGIECTYVWKSAQDGRTRHGHRISDGQIADMIDGKPRFKIPVFKQLKGKPPILVGMGYGTSPRLLKGDYQAANNINCRCTRLTIPMKYNPQSEVKKIDGKPSLNKYIGLITE